jgi:hypothetical protein
MSITLCPYQLLPSFKNMCHCSIMPVHFRLVSKRHTSALCIMHTSLQQLTPPSAGWDVSLRPADTCPPPLPTTSTYTGTRPLPPMLPGA